MTPEKIVRLSLNWLLSAMSLVAIYSLVIATQGNARFVVIASYVVGTVIAVVAHRALFLLIAISVSAMAVTFIGNVFGVVVIILMGVILGLVEGAVLAGRISSRVRLQPDAILAARWRAIFWAAGALLGTLVIAQAVMAPMRSWATMDLLLPAVFGCLVIAGLGSIRKR